VTVTDCVFCDIVAGTAPAAILQEWDDAIAFTPLNPVNSGHTLIIPRVHVPDAMNNAWATCQTMYRAIQYAQQRWHMSANFITSVGKPATQSIFHLHIHVIPRELEDKLMVPWGTTGDPHLPHRCKGMDALDEALARVNEARN
jgi:histidine triad (HIT) family protein